MGQNSDGCIFRRKMCDIQRQHIRVIDAKNRPAGTKTLGPLGVGCFEALITPGGGHAFAVFFVIGNFQPDGDIHTAPCIHKIANLAKPVVVIGVGIKQGVGE